MDQRGTPGGRLAGKESCPSVPPPRTGFLAKLGPGLITGAADDDPSGIATYSQVGAQFGYTMGWTMVLSWPLMAVTQLISAEIGAVTGQGIAQNLRRHYPPWVLYGSVLLLLGANVINLGADLGAMGAAVRLLLPGPQFLYTAALAGICVLLEILVPYTRYVRVLKWLTLSLLAYVATLFAIHVPWGEALAGALIPRIGMDSRHAMALAAVLGTTISPYLFFWQASEEVEEKRRRRRKRLGANAREARPELARIRLDTVVGTAFSNAIGLCIIIATAATLHANGITDIQTSSQAAQALRPLAGQFAFVLFAGGIIGTGLLAVPVLAGSAAYALAEMFGRPEGLERRPRQAKLFYGVIAGATLGGIAINLLPINPIQALYWSAVINGMLAAPLMAVMLAIGLNTRIMGRLTLPPWMVLTGGIAALVMAAASLGFFLL